MKWSCESTVSDCGNPGTFVRGDAFPAAAMKQPSVRVSLLPFPFPHPCPTIWLLSLDVEVSRVRENSLSRKWLPLSLLCTAAMMQSHQQLVVKSEQ